jgi:hypothetical protein
MAYTLTGIYSGMPNGKDFYELEKIAYVYKYRGTTHPESGVERKVFWTSYGKPDPTGIQSGYKILPNSVVILEQGYESLP